MDLTPDRGSAISPGTDFDIYTPYALKVGGELSEMFKSHQIPVQIGGLGKTGTRVAISSLEALDGVSDGVVALHTFIQLNKYRLITAQINSRKVPVNGFSEKQTEELLREAWVSRDETWNALAFEEVAPPTDPPL